MGGVASLGGERRGRRKKSVALVSDLLAHGLSRGLSLDDFRRMTPGEYSAWLDSDRKLREAEQRDSWERARLIAAVAVSPYLAKGASRDPKRIVPLPWDHAAGAKEKASAREITREEADALFEKRLRDRKAT